MKILDKTRCNISAIPGDIVNIVYEDPWRTRHAILRHEITERMDFDTAVIVQLDDGELGMESGIGGFFCKEQTPKTRSGR